MSQNTPANIEVPDPEVVPRSKCRQFAAEYKLRILEEADNCTEIGQVGRLLLPYPTACENRRSHAHCSGLTGEGAHHASVRRVMRNRYAAHRHSTSRTE